MAGSTLFAATRQRQPYREFLKKCTNVENCFLQHGDSSRITSLFTDVAISTSVPCWCETRGGWWKYSSKCGIYCWVILERQAPMYQRIHDSEKLQIGAIGDRLLSEVRDAKFCIIFIDCDTACSCIVRDVPKSKQDGRCVQLLAIIH